MDRKEDGIGSTVADCSLKVVTALSAEVVALRERLEIVEQLCASHGLFGSDEVDGFRPDPMLAAAFKAKRRGFLERVFGAMRVNAKAEG